jgi:hypothetical protein
MPIPDLTASKYTLALLFFMLLAGVKSADAQLVCRDEMMINPYYDCGTFFAPVCACDGETYRNECAARYHGGIQGSRWVSGPCVGFYFIIYPTVCLKGALTFQMQFKDKGKAQLYIINNFGQIKDQQYIEAGNNFPLRMDLDVTTLQAGIYFLVIQGTGHTQIERFIVLPS